MSPDWQTEFLRAEHLDATYLATARQYFDPLAARIAELFAARGRSVVIGLNGSQGSGKSTLCAYLRRALAEVHGLQAIDLSLDDFYLTRDERERLAGRVHPLLRTRGVPGTHDCDLLRRTLDALLNPDERPVAVPRFDKAEDDRMAEEAWTLVSGPVDVVLLEGWCLGATRVDEADLREPLNDLEREEDADGRWRAYVNASLGAAYEPLYGVIDAWIMLAAPGFEQVLAWRTEQEAKLRRKRGGVGSGIMDAAALRRFVDHFERVTRQCLATLPGRVDVLLQLDAGRNIIEARGLET